MTTIPLDPGSRLALFGLRISSALLGWILAGCVLLAVGLTIWGLKRKVETLEAAQVVATADGKASAVWREGKLVIEYQEKKQREETQAVLASVPEYSDADVPESVADRLRKRPESK